MCNVILAIFTPLSSMFFISFLVKCNDAVGAATLPSCFAKIGWYSFSSRYSLWMYGGNGKCAFSSIIFSMSSLNSIVNMSLS